MVKFLSYQMSVVVPEVWLRKVPRIPPTCMSLEYDDTAEEEYFLKVCKLKGVI